MIQRLNQIEDEIQSACIRSGRLREEITLIAVSKTQSIESILELYQLGIRDFGENKVQELLEKHPELPKDIRWHLIGHLQSNKVKYIVDKVAYIHSVDSLKLVEMINKEAAKINKVISIFIQVNIGMEPQKFGISKELLSEMLDNIHSYANVKVCGLMAIPPADLNDEEVRNHFKQMYQLLVDSAPQNRDNVNIKLLSMGMSDDFAIAIEEGAHCVRVGTKLFGSRNYN